MKRGYKVYIGIREIPQEVNDKNTQRLIGDIKRSSFSYLPMYGGYRNKDTWSYGHFHHHNVQIVDNTKFVMLDMYRNGIYDIHDIYK